MEFDEFFEHPFLKSVPSKPMAVPGGGNHHPTSPLQSPVSYGSPMTPIAHSPKIADEFPSSTASSSDSDQVDSDFVMVTADANSNTVIATTPSPKRRIRIHSAKTARISFKANCPEPIPVPTQKEAYEQIQKSCGSYSSSNEPVVGVAVGVGTGSGTNDGAVNLSGNNNAMITSPPTTPKSMHKPQSLQQQHHQQTSTLQRYDSTSSIGSTGSGRGRFVADISQLSPPTVQFMIGTPPGSSPIQHNRRRSVPSFNNQPTSPVQFRQFIPIQIASPTILHPIAGSPTHQYQSPPQYFYHHQQPQSPHQWVLRGSKTDPAINTNLNAPNTITGTTIPTSKLAFGSSNSSINKAITEFPHYNSPSNEKYQQQQPQHQQQYQHQQPQSIPTQQGGYCPFNSPASHSHQYHYYNLPYSQPTYQEVFSPPELAAETLLDRDHNETLAKLNFVRTLVDCILDLAENKANPISILTESTCKEVNDFLDYKTDLTFEFFFDSLIQMPSESYRKTEQLVLYLRALQLLSSALQLSKKEIQAGRLIKSESVKKGKLIVINFKFIVQ